MSRRTSSTAVAPSVDAAGFWMSSPPPLKVSGSGKGEMSTASVTAARDLTGMAQTVLGPIAAERLGMTMPHEHLFVDVTCMFDLPREATERARAYQPFTLENAGWIRYNYFRHYDNLLLIDEETTCNEVELFKRAGGNTSVEVTTPGIGRDPLALARVARATGINVIMSTGYYVAPTHPSAVKTQNEEEIACWMIAEIRDGACLESGAGSAQDWEAETHKTGIRAGIIKVGATYPLTREEKKVLRAAAEAQRETGAAITVHVGRHDRSAHEIVEVLTAARAELERVVLDHLDLRVEHLTTLDDLARTGCYLEFDLFGHEISYYPLTKRDMPSDAQRLDILAHVRELGCIERVLISQDICTKHRLVRYGGHGYGYICGCVVPRMRERGFSEQQIETILVKNPARVLAFGPPRGRRADG